MKLTGDVQGLPTRPPEIHPDQAHRPQMMVRSCLNKRGTDPAAASAFKIQVSYPEPGAIRQPRRTGAMGGAGERYCRSYLPPQARLHVARNIRDNEHLA